MNEGGLPKATKTPRLCVRLKRLSRSTLSVRPCTKDVAPSTKCTSSCHPTLRRAGSKGRGARGGSLSYSDGKVEINLRRARGADPQGDCSRRNGGWRMYPLIMLGKAQTVESAVVNQPAVVNLMVANNPTVMFVGMWG